MVKIWIPLGLLIINVIGFEYGTQYGLILVPLVGPRLGLEVIIENMY